jgi:hypothetical protein
VIYHVGHIINRGTESGGNHIGSNSDVIAQSLACLPVGLEINGNTSERWNEIR